MLDGFIIEELLERQRQEERLRIQPQLERPGPYPYGEPIPRRAPEPDRRVDDDDGGWDNGVLIIDM